MKGQTAATAPAAPIAAVVAYRMLRRDTFGELPAFAVLMRPSRAAEPSALARDEQAFDQAEREAVARALRVERGLRRRIGVRQHGAQERLHGGVVARRPRLELHGLV